MRHDVATRSALHILNTSQHAAHEKLFARDQATLLSELAGLPQDSAVRKIDQIMSRVKRLKAHVCLVGHLRSQVRHPVYVSACGCGRCCAEPAAVALAALLEYDYAVLCSSSLNNSLHGVRHNEVCVAC
jgi:hypothetical protein